MYKPILWLMFDFVGKMVQFHNSPNKAHANFGMAL